MLQFITEVPPPPHRPRVRHAGLDQPAGCPGVAAPAGWARLICGRTSPPLVERNVPGFGPWSAVTTSDRRSITLCAYWHQNAKSSNARIAQHTMPSATPIIIPRLGARSSASGRWHRDSVSSSRKVCTDISHPSNVATHISGQSALMWVKHAVCPGADRRRGGAAPTLGLACGFSPGGEQQVNAGCSGRPAVSWRRPGAHAVPLPQPKPEC